MLLVYAAVLVACIDLSSRFPIERLFGQKPWCGEFTPTSSQLILPLSIIV